MAQTKGLTNLTSGLESVLAAQKVGGKNEDTVQTLPTLEEVAQSGGTAYCQLLGE